MKRLALLFINSFFCICTLSAQYAVVVDEGGFVNVYDSEKEELDRLGSDGVVAIAEEDGEWSLVNYTKYGGYAASSGFVKKTNLIDISSYLEIPLITDSPKYIILSTEEITIRLSVKNFEEGKHKVTRFSEENAELITAIDDEPYWGTSMSHPTTEYEMISFTRGGETVAFPAEAFFNLYNPHLSLTKAFYDEENDIVYLYSPNGDVSGAYTALWVIEDGDYAIHYILIEKREDIYV